MWRNWQTRMVQVHVKAISWGFKSLHPHQKEQYPFGCCSFFVFDVGVEGRVLENSPVDCFPAPPLRPQPGKSLHPHQKLVERRAFFHKPRAPAKTGALFLFFCGKLDLEVKLHLVGRIAMAFKMSFDAVIGRVRRQFHGVFRQVLPLYRIRLFAV